MVQNDSGRMAQAYVADLCGYIGVANRENVRILGQTNLL